MQMPTKKKYAYRKLSSFILPLTSFKVKNYFLSSNIIQFLLHRIRVLKINTNNKSVGNKGKFRGILLRCYAPLSPKYLASTFSCLVHHGLFQTQAMAHQTQQIIRSLMPQLFRANILVTFMPLNNFTEN